MQNQISIHIDDATRIAQHLGAGPDALQPAAHGPNGRGRLAAQLGNLAAGLAPVAKPYTPADDGSSRPRIVATSGLLRDLRVATAALAGQPYDQHGDRLPNTLIAREIATQLQRAGRSLAEACDLADGPQDRQQLQLDAQLMRDALVAAGIAGMRDAPLAPTALATMCHQHLDADGSRYKRNDGHAGRALAAAADALVGHGGQDDEAGGADDYGHLARVGHVLILATTSGYREATSYPDADAAEAAFAQHPVAQQEAAQQ